MRYEAQPVVGTYNYLQARLPSETQLAPLDLGASL